MKRLADDLELWLDGRPISIKPASMVETSRRWIRNNQRLAFLAFAIGAGSLFCAPFGLSYFSGDMGEAYSLFPAEDLPVMFWLEDYIPEWVSLVFVLFSFFILWPAVGFLTAAILRPKSKRAAIAYGVISSFSFSLVLYILLGWMVMAQGASNSDIYEIQLMAEVVWPPEGSKEEASGLINEIFGGLEHIPENERAAVVARRIQMDQLSSAVMTMMLLVFVIIVFTVPVVYGTVIAKVVLERGVGFWIAAIRYTLAWWASLLLFFILFAELMGAIDIDGSNARDFPLYFWGGLSILSLVVFLSLRRWTRKSTAEISPAIE
jgi:hypothetical protein